MRFVTILTSTVFLGVSGLALAALLPGAAPRAQGEAVSCATRANVLAYLGRRYAEAPAATGLADNGATLEVLTTPEGETWTIILTMPDGTSCLIAAGEAWQPLLPATGTSGPAA